MQMRRPAHVHFRCTKPAEQFAGLHIAAHRRCLHAFTRQVSVKRVEHSVTERVLQNQGRSVIAESGVVLAGMHTAGQHGMHAGTGRQPEVDTQVQGARFAAATLRREHRAHGIQGAVFTITAGRIVGARSRNLLVNEGAEVGGHAWIETLQRRVICAQIQPAAGPAMQCKGQRAGGRQ